MRPSTVELIDHREILKDGMYAVHLNESAAFASWNQIHAWCKENLTARFTWLYVTFYFEDADDAIKFSLTWCDT